MEPIKEESRKRESIGTLKKMGEKQRWKTLLELLKTWTKKKTFLEESWKRKPNVALKEKLKIWKKKSVKRV